VNEADIDWPPTPWRIFRAFIAIWRRKLDPDGEKYRSTMKGLLTTLSSTSPTFFLPPATRMHTRHYMPVREGKKDKPVLIFDAAVHIPKGNPLLISWPVELTSEQLVLLNLLAENLGYLGRAESWVEASVDRTPSSYEPNCLPINDEQDPMDPDTGELEGEHLSILVPRTPEDYIFFRLKALQTMQAMKRKIEKERFKKTLPEDWLDALSIETGALHAAGWSSPPAAKMESYRRPLRSFGAVTNQRSKNALRRSQPTTLRYALAAKPLPRIEQTIRVGEWARLGTLGRAKKVFGEKDIPWQLSGHGTPVGNRHQHAFFLPEDADLDGFIDHLIIHVPAGLDPRAETVLRGLSYIKNKNGDVIQLIFEGLGSTQLLNRSSSLLSTSSTWRSSSPYLHPWHLKLKRNLTQKEREAEAHRQILNQIRRECQGRNLPEPLQIDLLPHIDLIGKPRRPIHFHRFRNKRKLVQPDRLGRFLQILFPEPVSGPLALGFGCHFGLGLFRSQNEE
jgi:CRISPR-associated protein Csb2